MKKLILLLALLLPVPAWSATYYVDDSGTGTTCAQAQNSSTRHKTINEGLTCLAAGDTLIIGDGRYVERIADIINGSAGAPTIVRAENPGKVTVSGPTGSGTINIANGSYITVDGIIGDGANTFDAAWEITGTNITLSNGAGNNAHTTYGSGVNMHGDNNQLLNWTADNNGDSGGSGLGHAVYMSGANLVVENLTCTNHRDGWGLHIYGPSIVNSSTVNRVSCQGTSPQGAAILVSFGTHRVSNFTVRGFARGVDVYSVCTGCQVVYGSIYGTQQPIKIENSTATSTVIRNVAAFGNTINAIQDNGTGTITSHNNFGASNPLWVNAPSGDFTVASTSPLRSAGISIPGIPADALNAPRGNPPTIGAVESGGTALPLPPPPVPPPAPPPSIDPCVLYPMRTPTNIKWPSSRTGTRSLTWSSGTTVIVAHDHRWPVGGNQSVKFTDERGCTVTVVK